MSTSNGPELDAELTAWAGQAPATPQEAEPDVESVREGGRVFSAAAAARLRPELKTSSWVDRTVDGPAGPIPVRIFTPPNTTGPVPIVAYAHGGGWVAGDVPGSHDQCGRLAIESGSVVVSIEYRLAPEHLFPAAIDDCLAVADWAAANASDLGADPGLLVAAGGSAGGQLAASVAIARRDAGAPIAAQLLLYPITDVVGRYGDPAVNSRYRTRDTKATGSGLDLSRMVWFADTYLGAGDDSDWQVSPMSASLTGLAPAIVHTAGHDVLGSEGISYAEALRAAGVTVIARDFPTLNHGYFGMGGISKAADAAASLAASDLRDILGLAARPAA